MIPPFNFYLGHSFQEFSDDIGHQTSETCFRYWQCVTVQPSLWYKNMRSPPPAARALQNPESCFLNKPKTSSFNSCWGSEAIVGQGRDRRTRLPLVIPEPAVCVGACRAEVSGVWMCSGLPCESRDESADGLRQFPSGLFGVRHLFGTHQQTLRCVFSVNNKHVYLEAWWVSKVRPGSRRAPRSASSLDPAERPGDHS